MYQETLLEKIDDKLFGLQLWLDANISGGMWRESLWRLRRTISDGVELTWLKLRFRFQYGCWPEAAR